MKADRRFALQVLAQEARAMRLDGVPEPVRRQARLCVLDTVGCMISGARTGEGKLILECELEESSRAPLVTVPGTSARRGLLAAVRINGYLGDVLELNDLIGGHASIGIVSAVLALAESLNSSGEALLEAVIRGIETTTRVYAAVYPTLKRYTDVGMVPVGIPSAIGAATAAACLLGLDEEQTVNAMAIAGGLAGWCPAEVIFGNGGTMKPLLFGAQPGTVGVTSAQYAKRGMTGPAALLDSKVGFFATCSVGGQLEPVLAPAPWALSSPRRKLHACCGYLHSAVDATSKLRVLAGSTFLGQTLQVRVAPYVTDVVSKGAPPRSPNDARFHLQYCVALAMCGIDVIQPEHSIDFQAHLADAAISEAMSRIRVQPDPSLEHYHQCSVAVDTGSRKGLEVTLNAPRGSPQDPLTDEQVIAKFMALAVPVVGEPATLRFARDAMALDTLTNTSDFMLTVAV